MKNSIEIRNLNKSFGNIKAVHNLSFDVRQGDLFAFLGVNGAGKSTTINMLCGQLRPDSGSIIRTDTVLQRMIEASKPLSVLFFRILCWIKH